MGLLCRADPGVTEPHRLRWACMPPAHSHTPHLGWVRSLRRGQDLIHRRPQFYNIVLVSAVQQMRIRHMYTYIPSLLSLSPRHPTPLRSSQSAELKLPVLYGSFPPAISFIHDSVYMSVHSLTQFIPSTVGLDPTACKLHCWEA